MVGELIFQCISIVAVSMAKVASDVKAADIRVLFVKPLVYWTRFFIIATAFSRPQIDAIGYCFLFGFVVLLLLAIRKIGL